MKLFKLRLAFGQIFLRQTFQQRINCAFSLGDFIFQLRGVDESFLAEIAQDEIGGGVEVGRVGRSAFRPVVFHVARVIRENFHLRRE